MGNIEIENGNRDKAVDYWDRALASNPQLSQAAVNKGAVLADAGELEDAAALFATAVRNGHPTAAAALILCKAYSDMDPAVGPRRI
jgi:tetratricopeptide (TPR) repeat protein